MTEAFEKWVENIYNKADWESPEEAGKVHWWLSAFVKEVERKAGELANITCNTSLGNGAAFNELIRDFGLDWKEGSQ